MKFIIDRIVNKHANEIAQNHENIKHGCLFYVESFVVGRSSTIAQKYIVDNIEFDTIGGISIKNSPFTKNGKYRQFYNDVDFYKEEKCYQVSYVKSEYIFVKNIYLYDYFGVEDIK